MEIRAIGISAGYGSKTVLHSVDFCAIPGEVVALLGPNGSGKTTLLNCLAKTVKLRKGEVLLGGRNLHSMNQKEVAKRVCVVPQFENPCFDFTVKEVVAMGLYAHEPVADANERIQSAAESACIAHLLNRTFDQLSGGEKQRVLVARAVAQDAPIMLLDEPTAHMDVGFQVATMSLVSTLARQGKTVVAAMHDLNLAAGFADRAVLLERGRVAAEGTVNAVLQSGEIERAFGAAFDRVALHGTDRLVLAPQTPPTLHDYRHPPIMPFGNYNP